MDIFKYKRFSGEPCDIEKTFETLLENEDIVLLHVPSHIQKQLSCVLGKEIFIDKPWKTISKNAVLEEILDYGEESIFNSYKNQLKNLKDPEVLVGYDTRNLDDENFFVCITNTGRNKIIEELKLLHENHMKFIEKANGMDAKPWVDLGSSAEIGIDIAYNNRPLISFEYLGMKHCRFVSPNFVNVDAGTSPHNYAFIKNTRTTFEQIPTFCSNKCIQTITECKDSFAQTIPEIPMNASTQFNPEIEAKEKEEKLNEPITTIALTDSFKKGCKKLMDALTYNAEYDLYKNDYEELAKCGQLLQIYPFLEYKHFVMFADITGDRNKYVTDTSWHPKYSGIVAVSYGNEVLCESIYLESNSDDSDFEYKPVAPRSFEPKVEKKKLIGEIVHAQSWMKSVLNYRKYRKRKEDDSMNKLAIHSLRCLKHSKDLRLLIIKMEVEHENSIPELDDLEFDEDFHYTKFVEGNPTPEEIIARVKAQARSNKHVDVNPNTKTRFDESIKKYKYLEKFPPTPEQMKTFNTIWDGKFWKFGEGIKEEALIYHKRHIAKAEKQIGKVILAPRNKSFFPFFRRKGKTEKHVETKTIRKSQSFSGASSATNRTRIQHSSTIKKLKSISQPSIRDQESRSDQSGAVRKKKKKKDIYREITDDEDDEKKNAVNFLSSEHPILIWWLANDLKAILHLDCPQEVHSINFCPHNGDIIIGGTITGQLVLWDLQGKLPPTTTSILRDTGEKTTYRVLKRKMSWFKDLQVPKWIKYAAITSLSDSHRSKVINIEWLPPNYEFNNGAFSPLKEDQNYSSQIISTSLDGEIKFWDLNITPRAKGTTRYIERLVGIRNQFHKPAALTKDKSVLAEFNKRWPSKYSILCNSPNNLPLQITSIQFEPRRLQFERVTPPNPHGKDKMGDIIEYKLKLNYEEETTISQNAFVGTMTGSVGFAEWKGKGVMGEIDKSPEVTIVKTFAAIHDGPITGVARHPFIDNIAISTGGHIYAIWNTRDMTWPIMWKRYYGLTVSCCSWSPLRPSLYRIGRSDGFVEIWDLILQSHEPKILIPASGERIICFSSALLKLPKGLLGILDSKASFILLYIPWFYQLWKKSELDKLNEIILREPPRREALLKWAETWRSMHVSRFAQRETTDSKAKVTTKKKVAGISYGEDEKKDCKKYYQELYKWYLRRRRRTPPWVVAMEQKRQTQEQDHVVNTILANKCVNLETLREQMLPLVRKDTRLKIKEEKVLEMLGEADKIFQTAAKEIFVDPEHSKKASQISLRIGQEEAFDVTDTLNEIELYFGPNGREMEKEYDEAISVKIDLDDKLPFTELVEKCKPSREVFNDRRRWRDPRNRWLREIVKNELEANGLSFRQWENHKSKYTIKKYKKRVANLKQLRGVYGQQYDPLWDFDFRPTNENERIFEPIENSEEEREDLPFIGGKSYTFAKFEVNESCSLDLDFLSEIENINKMFAKEHAIQFEKKKKKKKRIKGLSLYKKLGESVSASFMSHISSNLRISSSETIKGSVISHVTKGTEDSVIQLMSDADIVSEEVPVEDEVDMEEEGEEEGQIEKENKYEAWQRRMQEKSVKDIKTVRRIIAGKGSKISIPEVEEGDDDEYDFMDYSDLSSQDEIIYSGESIPSPGSSPPSIPEDDWKATLNTKIEVDKDQPFVEHFEGPPPGRHIAQVIRRPLPMIKEAPQDTYVMDESALPEHVQEIIEEPVPKPKKPRKLKPDTKKSKKHQKHRATVEQIISDVEEEPRLDEEDQMYFGEQIDEEEEERPSALLKFGSNLWGSEEHEELLVDEDTFEEEDHIKQID
ncbi:uncharacterized protein LOC106661528 [Cimex lectularius]|uniref:WD repeat-containing protein 63 n=1 Tax=Cimex lectularius TaxID=79782 RepID=A0A8I6TCZ7_CIMLE|nr:uncharacterized protein LOC106661528 [Cimex lectularius]